MPTLPLSKVVDVDDFSSPDLVPYLKEIDALASTRLGCVGGSAPDTALWEAAMTLRVLDDAPVTQPADDLKVKPNSTTT